MTLHIADGRIEVKIWYCVRPHWNDTPYCGWPHWNKSLYIYIADGRVEIKTSSCWWPHWNKSQYCGWPDWTKLHTANARFEIKRYIWIWADIADGRIERKLYILRMAALNITLIISEKWWRVFGNVLFRYLPFSNLAQGSALWRTPMITRHSWPLWIPL